MSELRSREREEGTEQGHEELPEDGLMQRRADENSYFSRRVVPDLWRERMGSQGKEKQSTFCSESCWA